MGFDPYNHSLKIWKSIGTPTPKVGVHLGVWCFIPSHSPTLLGTWNVTPGFPSLPAPSQTFALVASPRLGLQQNFGQMEQYHQSSEAEHNKTFTIWWWCERKFPLLVFSWFVYLLVMSKVCFNSQWRLMCHVFLSLDAFLVVVLFLHYCCDGC